MSQTAGVLGFGFSIDELATRYRDGFLKGGGVLVDENFALTVTLEPMFRAEDAQDWPADQRQRWERGERLTESSTQAGFVAAFLVRQDGTIEHRTP